MPSPNRPAVIHGVFQRLSIVKTDRALQGLITEYVDQASKKRAIDPIKAQAAISDDAAYQKMKGKKKLPQRPGKDFVISSHATPVFVGGFLPSFAPNHNLNDPQQLAAGLKQIGAQWEHLTNSYTNRAHHLLFSIGPDLQARCLTMGIPIFDVLMASTVYALNRFNCWAFPESNLGYIAGCHTDKPNSHIHAVLFPHDSQGHRLNLSRLAPVVGAGGRKMRVDFQGYLHGAYEEYLREFAELTAPAPNRDRENIRQAAARSALVSLRDFNLAMDEVDAGRFKEKPEAVVAISRANAEDYKDTSGLRAEQTSRRKVFAADVAPLSGHKGDLIDGMRDIASKVRSAAEVFGAQAEIIRQARHSLQSAHKKHAESPFAYRLCTLPNGSLPYPATITKEWAESLPEHGRLLLSDNPFLWSEGATRVADARMKESKEFGHVSREVCRAVAGTNAPLAEMPTRLGYMLGQYAEFHSGAKGANPYHLDTRISDAATPPVICEEDKGAAAVRHDIMERGNGLLMKHRPFDPATDDGRDYSPVYRRGEDAGDDAPMPEMPSLLTTNDALLYKPTGLNPDVAYEPTDLDRALEEALDGFKKTYDLQKEKKPTHPSNEASGPAMI